MSLSLYGVPDGQQKGQSVWPCPSVYSPATALGSLSSVALSSAPASVTLTQHRKQDANYHRFGVHISSGFLNEVTNTISSGFLREATGNDRASGPRSVNGRVRYLDRIFGNLFASNHRNGSLRLQRQGRFQEQC